MGGGWSLMERSCGLDVEAGLKIWRLTLVGDLIGGRFRSCTNTNFGVIGNITTMIQWKQQSRFDCQVKARGDVMIRVQSRSLLGVSPAMDSQPHSHL
jgi:hypothetical protein